MNFSDIGQNSCTANQFMMWSGTAWTCSAATGIAETDPKVGTLTANLWCHSNAGATQIICDTVAPPPAAHNHDGTYVRIIGDNMTGALTVGINGAGSALTSSNAGAGPGVTGQSTLGFGVVANGGGDASANTDAVGDLLLGGNQGEILSLPGLVLWRYSVTSMFMFFLTEIMMILLSSASGTEQLALWYST